MHFFNANLAGKIGINESIFLQNIYYLSKKRVIFDKDIDDELWLKMSSTKIQEFQPYFSRAEIRTLIKNLMKHDLLVKNQKIQRATNTSSYALTYRGWVLMLSLEKKNELKKIKENLVDLNDAPWSYLLQHLLKDANELVKSTNPWLILTKDCTDLTNIIIEYRNLIEKNRTIEKIKGEVDSEVSFFDSLNFDIQNQVEEIISENSIFKKRVEKSFSTAKNFYNKVVLPTIEKYGYLKVLKALKKSVEEFLPSNSPVANFYTNLTKLNV